MSTPPPAATHSSSRAEPDVFDGSSTVEDSVPGQDKKSQFSDPVYKQISRMKGQVNRMTKEELKTELQQHRLDTRGVKEVLKKRLKNFHERQKLVEARVRRMDDQEMADYLVVIDFEATCEEDVDGYPHEIIEFPAVLVSTKTHLIVDEFREFCKPQINPVLSPFCTTLTGITQDDVDHASHFPDVLTRVESWMKAQRLGSDNTFVIVTDGPWDMSRFLHSQCNHCQLKFPAWARKWINIRKSYRNYYGFRSAKLTTMLENLGMGFEGHQHSGIDDARNIARIAMRLLQDGAVLHPNEKIVASLLKENKKICINVATCVKGEQEDEFHEYDNGCMDSVTYSYNGQYEVSIQKNSKKSQKNVPEGIDWSEEVEDDTLDDVSDLMYWMSLKGK